MYNNDTCQIMKINSKNKVCACILAVVITSIIFVANTGVTKHLAQAQMNMNMSKGKMSNMSMNAGMCTTKTVPVAGVSLNKTYTVPKGFSGNPATASGKCVVDNTSYSTSHPCTIINGIATAGHCEAATKGYEVTENGPANLPTVEWFHLTGVSLKPGEFLDLADTTPFITTKGHMAMVLPCDSSGQPQARLFEGIIDAGVNTLEPADIEYLQQLSHPESGICVYHSDIGTTSNNPDGVTDFALINTSKQTITFTERNTSTFSVTKGYLNKAA
jgi:hypothetical protein